MKSIQDLSAIPDDDLLHRLAALLYDSRHTEADLVAHIAEVDARRLYAREATPSMFQYCTERLHLSGAEAYLRIAAGRAARANPAVLTMLADGRLHLTAVALLAPHLTDRNRDVLLARATHKTKREIEELVAEIAPRPDAPALIRKLPGRSRPWATGPAPRPLTGPATALSPDRQAPVPVPLTDYGSSPDLELRPDEVASIPSRGMIPPGRKAVRSVESGSPSGEPRAVEPPSERVVEPASQREAATPSQGGSIQPLSPAR